MTVHTLPDPGWLPDPHTPGKERWWTGTEWSEATRRAPRSDPEWALAWTRAMWPTVNRPARFARYLSWLNVLLVPGVVLIFIAPVAALVVLAIVTASESATVALGALALRQPRSQGGHLFAIWTMSFSSLFGLISAGVLVTVLLFHPAFR